MYIPLYTTIHHPVVDRARRLPSGGTPGSQATLGERERLDELADSLGLAGDPVALRARLAADRYVFFLCGLLSAEPVRAAGERVAAAPRPGGWTAGADVWSAV